MCSICKTVLPGFGIKHIELECPLRKSQYCAICARYGHLTKVCADTVSPLYIKESETKQFLTDRNIKYKKNHKRALYEYADVNGMRIVYIQ